jgi:hypothetical protein
MPGTGLMRRCPDYMRRAINGYVVSTRGNNVLGRLRPLSRGPTAPRGLRNEVVEAIKALKVGATHKYLKVLSGLLYIKLQWPGTSEVSSC